jgi:hypothetical protein
MAEKNDSQAVMLMTILQEPDAKKARDQYCKAFQIDEIKDHAVYDLLEVRVFDTILSNESTVEIETELAQTMLLLLKNGIKRSKGKQPNTRHQELRKRTLVSLARRRKAELIEGEAGWMQHRHTLRRLTKLQQKEKATASNTRLVISNARWKRPTADSDI